MVEDALIFGNGRDYPGILIVPSKSGLSDSTEGYLDALWPHLEKLNQGSPPHARIGRTMMTLVGSDEAPLQKSSKGTILRKQAEERFRDVIEDIFSGVGDPDADTNGQVTDEVSDANVPEATTQIIASVMGRKKIQPDEDLFHAGVDSMACITIRSMLQQVSKASSRWIACGMLTISRQSSHRRRGSYP